MVRSEDLPEPGRPTGFSNGVCGEAASMNPSLLAGIFVLATALSGGAYWWLDRKAQALPGVLRDSYKLGLIIVYGLQMALLLMFAI